MGRARARGRCFSTSVASAQRIELYASNDVHMTTWLVVRVGVGIGVGVGVGAEHGKLTPYDPIIINKKCVVEL